jgi:hypothetical protein
MTSRAPAATTRARARAKWDSFLLRDAERVAAACPAEARDETRALAQAGEARAAAAARILDGNAASALALYREAALLYMAAVVTVRNGQAPPEPLVAADVVARFQALIPQDGGAEAALDAAFFEGVAAPDVRAADRLAGPEALGVAQAARAAVGRLAGLVEPRGLPEIRFARHGRLALLALAACALVARLVAILIAPTNLALHKPVTTSGVHPAATSPPSGLTDGVTTGTYGVHTAMGHPPWVMVDLLDVYLVDEIKVYNRGDGWLLDSLPLTLQVSEDGVDFADVDKRTVFFGQLVPWKVELPHRRVRYIRVRGMNEKDVVLRQLEVFGHRP